MQTTFKLSDDQLSRWNHVRARCGVVVPLTMQEALKVLSTVGPSARRMVLEYLGEEQ